MRMSTVQIFNQGVNNLLDRQSDVTKTQEQLASGKRTMDASEDPAGTARVLGITSDLARIDTFQRNTDNLQGQLAPDEMDAPSGSQSLDRFAAPKGKPESGAERRSLGTAGKRLAYRG